MTSSVTDVVSHWRRLESRGGSSQ